MDLLKRLMELDVTLTELGESRGVTQTQIAEHLTTSRPNVSRIEREDDLRPAIGSPSERGNVKIIEDRVGGDDRPASTPRRSGDKEIESARVVGRLSTAHASACSTDKSRKP